MAKRRRAYTVYNPNEAVQVSLDEISPFISELVEQFPSYANRAARHVGYELQKQIKQDMRDENIAGVPLPKKSVLRNRYAVRKNIKRNALLYRFRKSGRLANEDQFKQDVRDLKDKHGGNKLFGGLIRAVGYQKIIGGVRVGWLSYAGAALGRKIQEGGSRPRTARMRRYMFAMGIGMRAGGMINQPPRPVIAPEASLRQRWMANKFQARIQKYIADAEALAKTQATGKAS